MHQSVPAVPIPPPPGNRGAFAHVVSPGDGTFAILSRRGCWAFAYPGVTPGNVTHVFLKVSWMSSAEKTRRLWSNGLSVRDKKDLLMFSQFWIFLHLLEIFNVKTKILRNKYNQKQLTRTVVLHA